jgi:hypothetical protein
LIAQRLRREANAFAAMLFNQLASALSRMEREPDFRETALLLSPTGTVKACPHFSTLFARAGARGR